jgi:hypothetical protein
LAESEEADASLRITNNICCFYKEQRFDPYFHRGLILGFFFKSLKSIRLSPDILEGDRQAAT